MGDWFSCSVKFSVVRHCEEIAVSESVERRSEPRTTTEEFHSVEFVLPGVNFTYQFRIWNMSPQGMCIVVKKDSGLLKHLNVGDVIDLRYHPNDLKDSAVNLRTEIRHITKQEEGKFKHHSLVGLVIAEKQSHGE